MSELLQQLNDVAAVLRGRTDIRKIVDKLKQEVQSATEAFVWSTFDLGGLESLLPSNIKSGWIFVLKRDIPSGCHYHPNSVQHMVLIEGQGHSNVGGQLREMIQFGAPDRALSDIWYVIDAGVHHEFFPTVIDMVVMSFHTCPADELDEIACETGLRRSYKLEA
ncbi:MAG TPA: hypothetical protein VKM94_25190 [Blastocatellia bacterium]|nr:hypothetical protein [Blastocatellia bacterium]